MGDTIATVLVLSLVVEITMEIIKSSVPLVRDSRTKFLSMILGILVSFTTSTGIFKALDISVSIQALDYFITGLIISRGSNIVHDLIKKINANFV